MAITIASRPADMSRPTIGLATPTTTVLVLLAFRELLELLLVALFELMAKLVLGSKTKLVLAFLLERAITETRTRKILSKYLAIVCSILSMSLRPMRMYSAQSV
jgi:hypothetical protein